MDENKQIKACAECMEHGIMALKLGQLCQWKESHEIGTAKWRGKIEDEMAEQKISSFETHRVIEQNIERKTASLKNWAIANLSAVIVILITLLAHLVFKAGP